MVTHDSPTAQHWLMTGASGFIGQAVAARLCENGHRVVGLSRQSPAALEHCWPGIVWISRFEDCPYDPSHVLNLAGVPIADQRWSSTRKQEIRQSRVALTERLSAWLQTRPTAPELIISGSAVSYYGTSPSAKTEASPAGFGFSAELCRDWEAALVAPAPSRIVLLRIGVVIGAGGMVQKLLPLYRMGLGGSLGSGEQMLSWISHSDLLRLIAFIVDNPAIIGALNATAPNPMSNRRFAQHLGRALHRPAWLTTPSWVIRAALGTLGEELLLAGQTVLPVKATAHGFTFEHPWMCRALNATLNSGKIS